MAAVGQSGSLLLAEELLQRGDAAFVEELRRCDDADRLGAFASKWFTDRRPHARRFLLDCLRMPLNAFRHEALVKRLFKLAEAAGDDEVMAHFLVLLDRSLRRVKRKRRRSEYQQFDDKGVALAQISVWEQEGAETTNHYEYNGRHTVYATFATESIRVPTKTAMPRNKTVDKRYHENSKETFKLNDLAQRLGLYGRVDEGAVKLSPEMRKKLESFTLFSVHTRHYLRRRAWRYFRRLAKTNPERYVPAVLVALKLYEDADAADGLALLDNWGLVHILFHSSPVLVSKANGWRPAEGRSLKELVPVPYAEPLWRQSPQPLLTLLKSARARPIRQWAIRFLGANVTELLSKLSLDELLELLIHEDGEVAALAADALGHAKGLDRLPMERWFALLETPNPTALDAICELMARHVRADSLTFEQKVRLAMSRPLPIARLGLRWLRERPPRDEAECQALLRLTETPADSLRRELVGWARTALAASPHFRPAWALEYLDSRHEEVRAEGWAWLEEDSRIREDVDLWRKLLESPYDDVRLKLVADLERRAAKSDGALTAHASLNPELVRLLWASVLLNIHRGGRAKPLVVRQMADRLERHPNEAPALLPILAVALRSVRGPDWRAGLAAVVRLAERRPELAALVGERFPELRLSMET